MNTYYVSMKSKGGINWDRKFPNGTENRFADAARAVGFRVTKEGWPDFICYDNDGGLILVEVKSSCDYPLSEGQRLLMRTLKNKYHVPCYKWSPTRDWMSIQAVSRPSRPAPVEA